ncbi:MAG: sulfite exporter TauE/SafE family protein [Sulfuricaulis sp.]
MLFAEIVFVLLFSTLFAMMGLGAAFLFVPFFYYLGVDLRSAIPTALFLNAVSMPFAAATYARARLIDYRAALPLLLAAAVLAPAGAWASQYAPRPLLLGLFTAFLIYAGISMLRRGPHSGVRTSQPRLALAVNTGAGAFAGFFGGLLGVGGGNFIVPVLNWLGYPPKVAVGTTALVVVAASWAGFLGHATLAALSPHLLLILGTTAVLGTLIGARLTAVHLHGQQVKRVVGIGLLLVAAKMLWDLA